MILVVLALIAAIGAIAYFTGGFTGEFKTFYLNVGDRDILTSASGFQVSVDEPLTVNVKYTFAEDGVNGYSVKVVPNVLQGKDFDFTVDGIPYSFQAETDLTAGFEIEESDSSFTLKPKGTLNEVMAAVYPNSEIEDLTGKGYENMFLLVVDSYNGESTVTLAFSIVEGVSGIEIQPGKIYF
jgi:hypothetical protein